MNVKTDVRISTGFMKIHRSIYEHNGVEVEREYWNKGDCVAIVPISDQNEIFLTRQPRIGIQNAYSVEIPAGYCEPKHQNKPLNAAKAELREEIGCSPEQCAWHYLGYVILDPDKIRCKVHLYLALHAKVTLNQELDEGELVEYFSMPFSEAVKIMEDYEDERLSDAPSIIGITRAERLLRDLL